MAGEIRDVAPGIWLWDVEYPDWRPGVGWGPSVNCTCVESGGEVVLLDAMAPPVESDVWARLDDRRPTVAVVLKPDHVRDVDLFVERYGVRAFGPWLFWRQNIPRTELEPVQPDLELPGGLLALYDGRWRMETPVWLPEQRAIVFADGMTAPEGELLVWASPWLEERVRPALRKLLELPFERVIVSHGEPVHDRAEFERALERPPWEE
jgi:glyoxylase-like metal-dependent hydrolase (beta-lactamase superfamily II)